MSPGKNSYFDYLHSLIAQRVNSLEKSRLISTQQKGWIYDFAASFKGAIEDTRIFHLSLPMLHAQDLIIAPDGTVALVDMDKAVYCDPCWDVANIVFRYSQGDDHKIEFILHRFVAGGMGFKGWESFGPVHLLLLQLKALTIIVGVGGKSDPGVEESIRSHIAGICSAIVPAHN